MKSQIKSNTFELKEDKDFTIPVSPKHEHCREHFKVPEKWKIQPSGSYQGEETSSEGFSYMISPKIQPNLIAYEVWKGDVLEVEEDSLVLDVRNERVKTIRRILRVKKSRIEGDVDKAFKGMEVSVLYKKFKTFHYIKEYTEVVEETTQFILSQPSQIPLSSRHKEFEERMQRYAYMFENGEQ